MRNGCKYILENLFVKGDRDNTLISNTIPERYTTETASNQPPHANEKKTSKIPKTKALQ